MANEIICDECKAFIKMHHLKLKDRAIGVDKNGNKVMERAFECPNCGKRYLVSIIDKDMQRVIAKRRKIQGRIRKATPKTKALIPRWIEEDQKLEKELLERESELRKVWCKNG